MSGAKHTPGPWVVSDERDWTDSIEVVHRRPNGMTRPICGLHGDGDTTDANARLIAAAPDLLAALQGIIALLDGENGPRSPLYANDAQADAARAAIAKAEGRPS